MSTQVIAAYEPCGCCGAVHVLDHHPADAYKMAAERAAEGLRIETLDIEVWRARNGGHFYCADHKPSGPPWWKWNGGVGKRPTEYQPQQGLGL